jgi:hypothetical protein
MSPLKRLHCCELWLLCAVIMSISAQAQKINVVYDKQTNFAQYKTFAWAPQGAVAHPMLAANIVGAIEQELQARGLQKVNVQDNPGLIIKIYGSIDQDSTLYSNDPLYMGSCRRSTPVFPGRCSRDSTETRRSPFTTGNSWSI